MHESCFASDTFLKPSSSSLYIGGNGRKYKNSLGLLCVTAPAPFCSITKPTRPLLCFPNTPPCHDGQSTLPHSPHSHEKHSCPFLSSGASHPTEFWQLSDLLRTVSFQCLRVPLYSQYQLGPLNQLLPWHFIQVTLAKAPHCFLRKSKSIPLPPLKLPLVQPCWGCLHPATTSKPCHGNLVLVLPTQREPPVQAHSAAYSANKSKKQTLVPGPETREPNLFLTAPYQILPLSFSGALIAIPFLLPCLHLLSFESSLKESFLGCEHYSSFSP